MQGSHLETLFPNLAATGYILTSKPTAEYNCIAWAAGDTQRWWWPSKDTDLAYWPAGIPRERTLERFVQAYGTLGYLTCEQPDLEEGFEKVAIYVSDAGLPTHAARQLPTGIWASKLGELEDIEHETLSGVDCNTYGSTSTILKRSLTENHNAKITEESENQ